jgi:hypothetical protein
MSRMRPPFNNWSDHPAVVVICVLAALVTIIGTIGSFLHGLSERRRVSEISVDTIEPTDTLESPSTSTDYVLNSEYETEEIKPAGDLKFECNEGGVAAGNWYWSCNLMNSSERTIWWKDSFQNEGSRLSWYCLENGESTCRAFTLLDKEMNLSKKGSIQFDFINSHESIGFWISCRSEPLNCRLYGRAPSLDIEEASFARGHGE